MKTYRSSQEKYNRLLDNHNARLLDLSHSECERLLMEAGMEKGQANNGAYEYLHHPTNNLSSRSGSREEYDRILNNFGAKTKKSMDYIRHLESHGFRYGQAKSAVHNYRKRHGLIRKT